MKTKETAEMAASLAAEMDSVGRPYILILDEGHRYCNVWECGESDCAQMIASILKSFEDNGWNATDIAACALELLPLIEDNTP